MKKLLIVVAVAVAASSTGCCGKWGCRRNVYATACPPPCDPCATGSCDTGLYQGQVYAAPPAADILPGPIAN